LGPFSCASIKQNPPIEQVQGGLIENRSAAACSGKRCLRRQFCRWLLPVSRGQNQKYSIAEFRAFL
jgi:hypothetical protein